MIVSVEVGGRLRTVQVQRSSDAFAVAVSVDGRSSVVDVTAAPGQWSLIVNGRSYAVAIDEHAGKTVVHVNGTAIPVSLPRRTRTASRGDDTDRGGGPRPVVAPMAGRVVKLLVKAGDVVAARQPLVVVEAMKMENELRASAPGTVAEVKVVEGAPVNANDVLLVMA